MSQSQILRRLGVNVTPQLKAQLDGNGKLQQYYNQKAALAGLPHPFDPSFAQALIQDLVPLAVLGGGAGLGASGETVTSTTGLGTGATAGGGAAAAGGGAASTGVNALKLGGIAAGITGAADFLGWISWIFHPLNLLRAVEFLAGIATFFYGLNTLIGGMKRSRMTHRMSLRSVFNWTPFGKATQMSRARRRGKRAGEIQAERDVAYRGARQARARREGAGKRTTPGSTGGTGGTGQGSSAYE